MLKIMRLVDIYKTAVDFPGEEIAAPALGLALSAPAGQKSMPARPPRGFYTYHPAAWKKRLKHVYNTLSETAQLT